MGAAECDPHFDLPVIHGSVADFLEMAAIPFNALMPELPSLMVAHLLLPDIDPDMPSSLSPVVIRQFLRRQLGYTGVVFTDDLCMGAISKRYQPAQAASLALRAGCDLPLICHQVCEHLEPIAAAYADLPEEVLTSAAKRIDRFRLYISTPRPKTFMQWDDYLRNLQGFNSSIPCQVLSQPESPVQNC